MASSLVDQFEAIISDDDIFSDLFCPPSPPPPQRSVSTLKYGSEEASCAHSPLVLQSIEFPTESTSHNAPFSLWFVFLVKTQLKKLELVISLRSKCDCADEFHFYSQGLHLRKLQSSVPEIEQGLSLRFPFLISEEADPAFLPSRWHDIVGQFYWNHLPYITFSLRCCMTPNEDGTCSRRFEAGDSGIQMANAGYPYLDFAQKKRPSPSQSCRGMPDIGRAARLMQLPLKKPRISSIEKPRTTDDVSQQAKTLKKHPTTERFLRKCCILPGHPEFSSTEYVRARELKAKFLGWRKEKESRQSPPDANRNDMKYLSPYLKDVHSIVKGHKKCGEVYFIQFRD